MRSWSGVKEAKEVFSYLLPLTTYLSPLTSNLPLTSKYSPLK